MPVGVVGRARLGPLPQTVVVEVREAAPPPGQALRVNVWIEMPLSFLHSIRNFDLM